jgi:ribose transport system permease protein
MSARSLRITPETGILLGLLVALIAVSAITTPEFATVDNGRTIVRAAALVGIAAIGLTFVTLSGNLISLSVEQTAAVAGVLLALMLADGWPVVLALLVVLAVAVLIGAVQGVVVAQGANPIIVTLGVGAALAGLAAIISGGKGVVVPDGALDWLGGPRPLGLPIPSYAFVVVAILATVYLSRRRAGRWIMLVGSNRDTARASGLPVRRTTLLAFALSAVAAAAVAVLTVAQFGRADAAQFNGLTFDALAAVLVGGAAIQGGYGSPGRTALGALFIATLGNFMVLNDYSLGLRLAVQGVVVVLAVTVFHLIQRRQAR